MTNSAIAELIKKFMDMDEDYALLKWDLHFDKTDTVKFSGKLVPKYRRNEK